MQYLLVLVLVAGGVALIFAAGHGLELAGRRKSVRRLREAGRTTSIPEATKKVMDEGFLFVEATTVSPAGLWVVKLPGSTEQPLEVVLLDRGIWVEDGAASVEEIRANPALTSKILDCKTAAFIDPFEG